MLDVEGGWSAVLHVPATRTEDEWVIDLAERDGVLVHPGYFFDFPREAYLVLSLLPPPARSRKAWRGSGAGRVTSAPSAARPAVG